MHNRFNRVRKQISLLLALWLAYIGGLSVSAAGTALVYPLDAAGRPGRDAAVEVYAEGIKELGAADISFYYPTGALTLTGVQPGPALFGAQYSVNDAVAGIISVSAAWQSGAAGEGTLLTLFFRVKDAAEPGTYRISAGVGEAYDASRMHAAVSGGTGTFTVTQADPPTLTPDFGVAILGEPFEASVYADAPSAPGTGFVLRWDPDVLGNATVAYVADGAQPVLSAGSLWVTSEEALPAGRLVLVSFTPVEARHFTLTATAQPLFFTGGEISGCVFEKSVVKAPTCFEAGVAALSCPQCGETRTLPLPVTPHTPDAPEKDADGAYRRVCTTCGAASDPYVPFDVDGNGAVEAADARITLRVAVGLESFPFFSAAFFSADADDNGTLTASDARAVLRAAVGLPPDTVAASEKSA